MNIKIFFKNYFLAAILMPVLSFAQLETKNNVLDNIAILKQKL
jgi:hypothetical protein